MATVVNCFWFCAFDIMKQLCSVWMYAVLIAINSSEFQWARTPVEVRDMRDLLWCMLKIAQEVVPNLAPCKMSDDKFTWSTPHRAQSHDIISNRIQSNSIWTCFFGVWGGGVQLWEPRCTESNWMSSWVLIGLVISSWGLVASVTIKEDL